MAWRTEARYFCEECYSVIPARGLLDAPNPFDPTDRVFGCPDCKAVESTMLACYAEGCESAATCGSWHPDGIYRSTCYRHLPA